MDASPIAPRQCKRCHGPMYSSAHQGGPRLCIACARGPKHRESEASMVARDRADRARREATDQAAADEGFARLLANRAEIRDAPPALPPPAPKSSNRQRRYSISLRPIDHQKIQVLAAEAGLTMSGWLVRAVGWEWEA